MTHPTQDELLLFAYDELPAARVAEIAPHVGGCGACQEMLGQFDRGRSALDLAAPARRARAIAGAALALAAAALLAALAIVRSGPVNGAGAHWTPTTTWSATAGYVTGGKAMVDIDAQLTRLEQEPRYGLPN